MAFEDNELTPQEKQTIMLANLYDVQPLNVEQAIIEAATFLNGESKGSSDAPRVYSFSKDAPFIFAAFRQTHGIDLQVEDIHWHKFLALFMDLGSETTFCQLVSLRSRVKSGKATKEEKQAAREMGETFDVPELDDMTLEEREEEEKFMRLLRKKNGAV